MEITIERRAAVPGDKDVKFSIGARSLDKHTHSELTTADRQAIRNALVKAADAVEEILRKQA